MIYTKSNENDLINILRTLPIHDAVFNKLEYEDGKLTAILNSFGEHKKTEMIFHQLRYSAFHPSSEWGGDESIYCFSVIQDPNEIEKIFSLDEKHYANCMFFLFEMFSGSKLQIVCKELIVNTEC